MKLEGIEQSLKEGGRLHGFRSGGGLRVISIREEEDLKGYGEHPNVEDALSHADEDITVGHREYKDVYGKLKPHYLTGSSQTTSPLDVWLLKGNSFDAYREDDNVVVELRSYSKGQDRVVKTGRGSDLNEALSNAFDVSEEKNI